jgi:hypothetical protein
MYDNYTIRLSEFFLPSCSCDRVFGKIDFSTRSLSSCALVQRADIHRYAYLPVKSYDEIIVLQCSSHYTHMKIHKSADSMNASCKALTEEAVVLLLGGRRGLCCQRCWRPTGCLWLRSLQSISGTTGCQQSHLRWGQSCHGTDLDMNRIRRVGH